jgi:hypothetical protein
MYGKEEIEVTVRTDEIGCKSGNDNGALSKLEVAKTEGK